MESTRKAARAAACAALLCITSAWADSVVTPEGFEYSTFVGYQAWFNVPNDGTNRRWTHWGTTDPLNAQEMVIDMWPDGLEYPADAQQATGFALGSGAPALAYSAYNDGVIDTHFRWMQEHDIAGAFLQWFVVDDANYRLQLGKKVQASAEKYGRKLVIMFDIAGTKNDPACATGPALVQCLQTRWMSAVDSGITGSPNYQRFNNKPLVALWGLGMQDNDHLTAADAAAFINWLHSTAPANYQAAVMGGVSTGWRTNSAGAINTDTAQWQQNYASLDIVSPWTVGRYTDDASASAFIRSTTGADLTLIRQRNQRYLPVMFPGFSWVNLKDGPPNQIPRRGGQFMWTQAREYAALGITSNYLAMFDEVDEGTAIYKTAPTAASAPTAFYTVTLDADRMALPSDWYLQVNGIIVNAIRQPGYSGFLNPALPLSVKAGNLNMPAGTLRFAGPFNLAYQTDGNLVIYNAASVPVWASNTSGRACSAATCSAVFQADGNFVLYQNGAAYWATQTAAPNGTLLVSSAAPFIMVLAQDGTPQFTTSSVLSVPYGIFNVKAMSNVWFSGGRLSYQPDGNLVVYDAAGTPLWASNTAGRACTPSSCMASFQPDGNFVLSDNGVPYWATGTAGTGATHINISGASPVISLTNGVGQPVWQAQP
jgi:hypothetical protein